MTKWKTHQTNLKKHVAVHTKMLCLDCKKQIRLNFKNNCCECSGTRVLEAGKAYRVPRKTNKPEWKYLESLFVLYPERNDDGEIQYIGFHPNRLYLGRPQSYSRTIRTKGKWIVTETGGYRDIKTIRITTDYDASPDLTIKHLENICKSQQYAINKNNGNRLKKELTNTKL